MGFLEKVILDAEQLAAVNELIPGAAVNTQESFKFRKINYRNQIFYSKSCSKVTKRNSYTVVFVGRDGNLKVGIIVYYLKLLLLENARPYHLFAVRELHPYPEERIMSGIDVTTLSNRLGGHLKPFHFPRFVCIRICMDNFPLKTLKLGLVAFHSVTLELKCLDFQSNQCKKLVPVLSCFCN